MLLQDLPEKTFHRLVKSVTWTEVEGAFPIKHWLRRFIGRVAQPDRWVMSVRKTILHHPLRDDRPTTQEADDRGSAP
jgi:hypothetical protein